MDEDEESNLRQHLLCVPVRETACGFVLRTFRDRDGSRCAVAFSSEERLRAVLGDQQSWLPLAEPALRGMSRPLGIEALVLDPNMIAPTVRETSPAPAAVTPAVVTPAAVTPAAVTPAAVTPAVVTPAALAPAAAARAAHGVGAAAHRAPRWRTPVGAGVLQATVAVGAADLLLQLLS